MLTQTSRPAQLGRYRLLDTIGEGTMGTVYLAEDSTLGRQVALKVPHLDPRDDRALRRFYREARTAAAIEHPNLCPVYDVGEADGLPYLTMPHLDGPALSELVGPERPWPPAEAVHLVRRLALAAGVLHRQGLVHRDIKPGNVILRPGGEPVLMDFGLARPFGASGDLTEPGMPLGTPAYMAPEQALGTTDIGPAADVYSLGAILYHLLTGSRPFEGPVAAVYAQILNTPPEAPSSRRPGLDPRLDALCLRALAKRPEDRLADAGALAAALTAYLTTPTVPAEGGSPGQILCLDCNKPMRVPPALHGKPVRCPYCGARFTPSQPGELSTPTVPAPVAPISEPEPAPVHTLPDVTVQPVPGRLRRATRVLAGVMTVILLGGALGNLALPGWPWSAEPVLPAAQVRFTNSLGMALVRIPAGTFRMGSPLGENGRKPDEEQHAVEITRPFYLGTREVTVGQFRQFVEETGYRTEVERASQGGIGYDPRARTFRRGHAYTWRNTGWEQTDDHPVVNVTWNDAVAFCKWLSRAEGRTYELPTEAEWEYACRAGTATAFWVGNDLEDLPGIANVADGTARVKFQSGTMTRGVDGFAFSAPVGRFRPSAWGLHDMHGNAWEWCADWYSPYDTEETRDPKGPALGRERVLRGGSWYGDVTHCRSARRFRATPDTGHVNFGFRIVLRPGR
jgi:eukaryotic-like serine/threonine-protein kinase